MEIKKLKTIEMKNGKIVISELIYSDENKHISVEVIDKKHKMMATFKVYEYPDIADNLYWKLHN